ncbi:unnamed protein product [Polarella glacialis]|uniref:Pseudouridine synthase RsuA/RluA-like domain-containing protein n=1 Tax=Polarella glacialis TaxID=89957 RepID=A0A813FLL8_POLGL|nr:unnamed protein product [Polarella glacialis]
MDLGQRPAFSVQALQPRTSGAAQRISLHSRPSRCAANSNNDNNSNNNNNNNFNNNNFNNSNNNNNANCLLRLSCVPAAALAWRSCWKVRRRRVVSGLTRKAQTSDSGASLPDATFRILLEDEHVLVVDKGSGLLTAPGRGPEKADCLLSRLRESGYPEIGHASHRLDRDTSGITVLGRTKAAQRALSIDFEGRRVEKTYEALVWGWPEEDEGVIDKPIGKVKPGSGEHARMVVVDDGFDKTGLVVEGVRPCKSSWRILSRYEPQSDELQSNVGVRCARVSLQPLTGRNRQLRLHMAALGHPLLGDTMFGEQGMAAAAAAASPRLCLHASSLKFHHPQDQKLVQVACPAPF